MAEGHGSKTGGFEGIGNVPRDHGRPCACLFNWQGKCKKICTYHRTVGDHIQLMGDALMAEQLQHNDSLVEIEQLIGIKTRLGEKVEAAEARIGPFEDTLRYLHTELEKLWSPNTRLSKVNQRTLVACLQAIEDRLEKDGR